MNVEQLEVIDSLEKMCNKRFPSLALTLPKDNKKQRKMYIQRFPNLEELTLTLPKDG